MTSEVLPVIADSTQHVEPASVTQLPGFNSGEQLYATAYDAQQAALQALPFFDISVKHRKTHKDPESNRNGIFHQESVRYSNGSVRLVTIGLPHRQRCDYPIVSGDPWYSGPTGFNRLELEQLVALGFPVVWNHHQGRHAVAPTNLDRISTTLHFLSSKSVGKSAAQEHALLDDLGTSSGFRTDQVIRKGYSRSAMAGEAFAAQGDRTIWSDLEAACFARKVGHLAFSRLVTKQLPYELMAIYKMQAEARSTDSDVQLNDYLGTLDIHPLNLLHELGWLRLLINGDAGKYAEAVPLDANGVRTMYKHDYSSQQTDWRRIHAPRQGLAILEEDGAHLSGATPHLLAKKQQRYTRLRDYAEAHNGSLSGVSFMDVLPEEQLEQLV